ncbi:MAG TPA: glucan biosynthesis protein G [Verrucomicrobiae bacterium]|nr:glucan biosynthesis protein G [Verrucomicrobiae bacterium]
MWRWICLVLAVVAGLAYEISFGAESAEVNLDYVAQRALERARRPFHSPREDLPAVLRQDNLDYDKYREIEFRHDKALWRAEGLPFRVEFFHPGYLYQEPVHINEFTATHTQPIRFSTEFFNYRALHIQSQIPANTGYAGFRLLYQLNAPGKWDELGSFLGASYFRLLGKGQRYGASARGLALNCGGNGPEEFPIFTDWWLGKPQPGDNHLVLYAILDSVSCTGAYEFDIYPGETTVADVEAELFFREPEVIRQAHSDARPIQTIGLAPLTSMFWFGKTTENKPDDYRGEVHDSDGLLMHMGNGEILWRPLDDPPALRHQIFHAPDIKGFGLLQRERNFAAYQDTFNYYQQVPSIWVEPRGDWGDGDLHLVELSTHYEGLDNVVAFWDPKNKPAPLQPYRFGYQLRWESGAADVKLSENRVVSTRVGLDAHFANARQFVIDFAGPKIAAAPETHPPVAIANCSPNAAIVDNFVTPNPFINGWRVVLKMQPKSGNTDPVDLRCTLLNGTNTLSETWTYQWSPP